MQHEAELKKFLSDEFGLSDKEIALYLLLLKNGPSTVLELSEDTGINRATTHVNIEYLTKKKLVAQVRKGKGSRRSIMAEPPERLGSILKEKKAKIEAAEDQLPKIIASLADLKEPLQKTGGMEIRYYKGKNEVRFIYDDVLKAKEIRTYANVDKIAKIFPENVNKFHVAHSKNPSMHIWEIMKDSPVTRKYAETSSMDRCYCKLVKDLNLESIDYILYDGKTAIIEAASDVIGVVIENENFYNNSREIHKFVWNFLPDYKK